MTLPVAPPVQAADAATVQGTRAKSIPVAFPIHAADAAALQPVSAEEPAQQSFAAYLKSAGRKHSEDDGDDSQAHPIAQGRATPKDKEKVKEKDTAAPKAVTGSSVSLTSITQPQHVPEARSFLLSWPKDRDGGQAASNSTPSKASEQAATVTPLVKPEIADSHSTLSSWRQDYDSAQAINNSTSESTTTQATPFIAAVPPEIPDAHSVPSSSQKDRDNGQSTSNSTSQSTATQASPFIAAVPPEVSEAHSARSSSQKDRDNGQSTSNSTSQTIDTQPAAPALVSAVAPSAIPSAHSLLSSSPKDHGSGRSASNSTSQSMNAQPASLDATAQIASRETGANTAAAASRQAESHTLQKTQIAFSVNLPKTTRSGEQQTQPAAAVTGKTPAVNNSSESSKNSSGKQPQSDKNDAEYATFSATGKAVAATREPQGDLPSTRPIVPDSTAISAAVPRQYAPDSSSQTTGIADSPLASRVADVAEPPQTPAVRPQSIDLKVATQNDGQVDVRVSQRGGDVQVTVRTPDGGLAQSLRQHLPELSDRLAQNGLQAAIWNPGAAAETSTNTSSDNSGSWSRDGGQNEQQRNPDNGSQNGQEKQQQQRAWLDELNNAEKEGR